MKGAWFYFFPIYFSSLVSKLLEKFDVQYPERPLLTKASLLAGE